MLAPEIVDFLSRGGSLRELAAIDEKPVHILYRYACQCIRKGQLKQAEDLLKLLLHLDHWNFNVALSLGLCLQIRGAHEEALFCFVRAASSQITDPRPPYYAALSYQKKGNMQYARRAFEAALHWASNQPEYLEFKQKSEAALCSF